MEITNQNLTLLLCEVFKEPQITVPLHIREQRWFVSNILSASEADECWPAIRGILKSLNPPVVWGSYRELIGMDKRQKRSLDQAHHVPPVADMKSIPGWDREAGFSIFLHGYAASLGYEHHLAQEFGKLHNHQTWEPFARNLPLPEDVRKGLITAQARLPHEQYMKKLDQAHKDNLARWPASEQTTTLSRLEGWHATAIAHTLSAETLIRTAGGSPCSRVQQIFWEETEAQEFWQALRKAFRLLMRWYHQEVFGLAGKTDVRAPYGKLSNHLLRSYLTTDALYKAVYGE